MPHTATLRASFPGIAIVGEEDEESAALAASGDTSTAPLRRDHPPHAGRAWWARTLSNRLEHQMTRVNLHSHPLPAFSKPTHQQVLQCFQLCQRGSMRELVQV